MFRAFSDFQWACYGMVWVFFGLVALGLAELDRPQDDWRLHGAWCVAGLFALLPLLRAAYRKGSWLLVTDHLLIFCFSFGLYFLFGASFMAFGNPLDVSHALNDFPAQAVDGLRADAINAIGLGVALVVAAMSSAMFFRKAARLMANWAVRVSQATAVNLLVVAGIAVYIYVLSYDLGFRSGLVPGGLRVLAKVPFIAIFLAASVTGRKEWVYRSIAILVMIVVVTGGLLTFNKSDVLIGLSALVVGISVRYRNWPFAVIGFGAVAAIFVVISAPVAYARESFRPSDDQLRERAQVLVDGYVASIDVEGRSRSPWARLSYVTSQAAAMSFYDGGRGGSEFSLVPWVFVPRFMSESKPIMTGSGSAFYTKMSGQVGSSTGQGIFSSGYYSGGWLGVLAVGCLAGWILRQTSAVAEEIIIARAPLLLPLALYGVYIAFRIDGSFLADYVGAFAYLLYPMVAFRVLVLARGAMVASR